MGSIRRGGTFSLAVLVCSFLLLGNIAHSVAGTALKTQWDATQQLYDAGKYSDALSQIMRHPPNPDTSSLDAANFYYNAGVMHYQLGSYGKAVAHFEKANKIQPYDSDTRHNLQLAREGLTQLLGMDRIDPASSWVESIADRAPLDEVRGILGLLASILVIFWIRVFWRTRNLRETLLRPAGYLGVGSFLVTLALYGAQRIAEQNPPTVALEAQVVRSGPGDHFLELGRINAGTKVRDLGEVSDGGPDPASAPTNREQWRQIRFSENEIGWVRASSLLLL